MCGKIRRHIQSYLAIEERDHTENKEDTTGCMEEELNGVPELKPAQEEEREREKEGGDTKLLCE